MPFWDSAQYLKFAGERTQPAIDLAARITLEAPARVIDLGCGPGNSTAVLARRWPAAAVIGLDSSPAMIAAARRDYPQIDWQVGDIATWRAEKLVDVLFSNAALQWVPGHANVFPQLLAHVAPHGAFALQVPGNFDAPAHRLMRELGASASWRDRFRMPVREWHVETPEFYYDLLAARTSRIELWTTEYLHVLAGAEGIVDWYRGTGLRPWLEALPDPAAREDFLRDACQRDGRVLFPFRRIFVVAYR